MEPKILIGGLFGKTFVESLGWWTNGGSDKWNCVILWILAQLRRRVIWTLDNLDRPLFLVENSYLLLKKKSPFVATEGPLPCIKHTTGDMDRRTNLRFKENGGWVQSKENCLEAIRGKSFP